MALTLKEESILNEWSMILDNAAGNGTALLDQIRSRLSAAKFPGHCTWEMEEVRSTGLLSRVQRDFLVIDQEQFRDYHMFVGVRDFGIHLDCCRFLTVDPGFLKKWASTKLTGYADALSAPKNILIHQDLRAWVTVVHHCVIESVDTLMKNLGLNPSLMQRGSKGFLEIW